MQIDEAILQGKSLTNLLSCLFYYCTFVGMSSSRTSLRRQGNCSKISTLIFFAALLFKRLRLLSATSCFFRNMLPSRNDVCTESSRPHSQNPCGITEAKHFPTKNSKFAQRMMELPIRFQFSNNIFSSDSRTEASREGKAYCLDIFEKTIFYVGNATKVLCCRLSAQGRVQLYINMVRPASVAGLNPEGVRKSLVQQQSEITVRDPSGHAARQVQDCQLETHIGIRPSLVRKY